MGARNRFFFVKANTELNAVNQFIQTRFKSLFSNAGGNDKGTGNNNFIESIREASEQRFLQHTKIANQHNLKLNELYRLSLYEYYLLIEDMVISNAKNNPHMVDNG